MSLAHRAFARCVGVTRRIRSRRRMTRARAWNQAQAGVSGGSSRRKARRGGSGFGETSAKAVPEAPGSRARLVASAATLPIGATVEAVGNAESPQGAELTQGFDGRSDAASSTGRGLLGVDESFRPQQHDAPRHRDLHLHACSCESASTELTDDTDVAKAGPPEIRPMTRHTTASERPRRA